MIRTLIEVSAENVWEHKRQLEAALDKLGFGPKESAAEARWRGHLYEALREMKLDPEVLVEERQARLLAERESNAA